MSLLVEHVSRYGERPGGVRDEVSSVAAGLMGTTTEREKEWKERLGVEGRVRHVGLTAREVLNLAVETPRSAHDVEGQWAKAWPRALVSMLAVQRWGRRWSFGQEGMGFEQRARGWEQTVRDNMSRGRLWEAGLLLDGRDGQVMTVGVSVPFSAEAKAWLWWLTAPRRWVVRREVGEILESVDGRTMGQRRVGRMLETTDDEAWWGMLGEGYRRKNLVRGSRRDVELRTRPTFGERVVEELRGKVDAKGLHEAVVEACGIYGYMVTAEGGWPRAVDLQAEIGKENLVAEAVGDLKVRRERWGIDDKAAEIWRRVGDGIMNTDGTIYDPQELRVHVGTQARLGRGWETEMSTVVRSVVSSRRVRAPGGEEYVVTRALGEADANWEKEEGEGVTVARRNLRRPGLVKHRPLVLNDVRVIEEDLERAMKRGVMDEEARRKRVLEARGCEGLSEETAQILMNAREFLMREGDRS